MAESSSWTVSPACILIVYGIPGSGKTVLSTALLEQTGGGFGVAVEIEVGRGREEEERDPGLTKDWVFYAVHFDKFYPPDLREREVNDTV